MKAQDLTIQEELEKINARLESIRELSTLSVKKVLGIDDASLLTGVAKSYLYRLTSTKRIPHYKQGNKVYFSREELEDWMLANKVKTKEDIESEASTYCVLKRRKKVSG